MDNRHRALALRSLWGMGALLVLTGLSASTDLSLGPFDPFLEKWSVNVVLVGAAAVCLARGALVEAERKIWLLLGLSILLWAGGNLYYTAVLWDLDEIPYMSVADRLWIASYVPLYAGVIMLIRSRHRGAGKTAWMDGIIAALAVAAVGSELVFESLLDSVDGMSANTVLNLSLPAADIGLLALAVAALSLNKWRLRSTFGMLCAGLTVYACVDAAYLVLDTNGAWVPGNIFEGGWAAAMLLIAAAAWMPQEKQTSDRRWLSRSLLLPSFFSVVALAVLVYDHYIRVVEVALILATASLALVIARMARTFHENLQMIDAATSESFTDPLTGIDNRRRLMLDLEELCDPSASDRQTALLIFDLDGFKNYNDTFGHPAGDALLARLGKRLQNAANSGRAYRMGGDEFCMLYDIDDAGTIERTAAELAASFIETGDGFSISASHGWALVPEEADEPSTALRLADRRMYERKSQSRIPAKRQSSDVLLAALRERDPNLGMHLHDVKSLVIPLCETLGMGEEDTQQVILAAELHDVGKVAIPDAILNKPEPLSYEDWAFMRRHTLIGQRILMAAPALSNVGRLVRSSHERWDGDGYPDGLVGEEIPLGARVVAVCDAFDAMTSDRPYRARMTTEEAIAELRRQAGTQFDPEVVAAFCAQVDQPTLRLVTRREATA